MKNLFLYAFLYMKIKDSNKTSIVSNSKLKEILRRTLIRKGGLPNFLIKYVIEDLVKLQLLKRKGSEYIISQGDYDKRIKQLSYFF